MQKNQQKSENLGFIRGPRSRLRHLQVKSLRKQVKLGGLEKTFFELSENQFLLA